MPTEIARRLLEWYRGHARQLPWRLNPHPYPILVSEVMLQQTRVETVLPYYLRWMERFPDLQALAAASEQEVLRLWEGLGYYSRARSLHAAARQIQSQYGGQVPADRKVLESLPGIGRYTAGAILSIAFGQDEAALDGNIRRVMARLFNLEVPAQSPRGQTRLWQLAIQQLPPGQAGDYNQALMDLGAMVCTARSPGCPTCPLSDLCQSYRLGLQEQRPIKTAPRPVPHYTVTAAVIRREDRVLIARRPSSGLLGGMWEFPGGKLEDGEELGDGLRREIREELGVDVRVGTPLGIYRHAYTHFRITLHAFECSLLNGEPVALEASQIRWVLPQELGQFPMGKVDRQIALRLAA